MSPASVEVLDASVPDVVEHRASLLLRLYAETTPISTGGVVPKRPKHSREPWFLVEQKWFQRLKQSGSESSLLFKGVPGPLDNSSLLVDPARSSRLKPRLVENLDYVAVCEAFWHSLQKWYEVKGPEIMRHTTSDGKIEVYPPIIKVSIASDADENEWNPADEFELEFRNESTLDEVYKAIESRKGISGVQLKVKGYSSFSPLKLDESNMASTIGSLNWGSDTRLLAVLPSSSSVAANSDRMDVVSSISSLSLSLGSSASSSAPLEVINKGDGLGSLKLGLCGLSNLGNTCYMNSVLQCLSHTPPLRALLLSGEAQKRVNIDSKFGRRGAVVDETVSLLKQMWTGKNKSVAPNGFKRALDAWTSLFRGYRQQDAHEFLAFLLDGLHEDTNHGDATEKPSVGESLYTGRLHSTLTCPECLTESKTSESYQIISIELPSVSKPATSSPAEGTSQRTILLVRPDGREELITLTSASLDETAGEASEKLRVSRGAAGMTLASVRDDPNSDGSGSDYRHLDTFSANGKFNLDRAGWSLVAFELDEPVSSNTSLVHCVHQYAGETGMLNVRPFLLAINPGVSRRQLAGKIERLFSAKLGEHFVLRTTHRSRKITDLASEMTIDDTQAPLHFAHGVLIVVDWKIMPSEEIAVRLKSKRVMNKGSVVADVLTRSSSSAALGESLKSRMEAFCAPEVLTGDDLWHCSKCDAKRSAAKQISLDQAMPEVLILHLKRFNSLGEKLSEPVLYQSMMEVNGVKYELTGVIRHHGSTISLGHYDAMVRSSLDEKWYNMNDSSVTPVPEAHFGKVALPGLDWNDPSAYVFFYTKARPTTAPSLPSLI